MARRTPAVCKECRQPARKPIKIIGETVCTRHALQFAARILGEPADYEKATKVNDSTDRMDMGDWEMRIEDEYNPHGLNRQRFETKEDFAKRYSDDQRREEHYQAVREAERLHNEEEEWEHE